MIRKLCFIGCLALMCALVVLNSAAAEAARQGFLLWSNAVLPALLPFFVCTSLLFGLGLLPADNRVALFLLSFLSGAPSGARLCAELESKGERTALAAALNVVSPMYICSAFCKSMLQAQLAALPILIGQLIAAAAVYIPLSMKFKPQAAKAPKQGVMQALREALWQSVKSVFMICGVIVFFTVLIRMLEELKVLDVLCWLPARLLNLFGLPQEMAKVFLTGCLEVVSGSNLLAQSGFSLRATVALGTFFFSFGGLCILAQSGGFLPLRPGCYLLVKLAQGALAALTAWAVFPLFFKNAQAVLLPIGDTRLVENSLSAAAIFGAYALAFALLLLICAAAKRLGANKNTGRA